jgi:hypothetical protein
MIGKTKQEFGQMARPFPTVHPYDRRIGLFSQPIPAWTDYPIVELGDEPGRPAPVRRVEVIGYDGDKYATVLVGGISTIFKRFYLYSSEGRAEDFHYFDVADRGKADRLRRRAHPSMSKMRRLRRQVATRHGSTRRSQSSTHPVAASTS